MGDTFKIVHLSDTHFGKNYYSIPNIGKPSHSIPHLSGIKNILIEYFNNNLDSIDKVIISGDLSERGDIESLYLANDWLFGKFIINNEDIGLKLKPSQVGLVPGNHDAYNIGSNPWPQQRSLDHISEAFKESEIQKYDLIQKNNDAIYIVYVDSSLVGEVWRGI